MLSAKGLLTSRPKQGIRVLPESNWNMFDTDVLRWILSSKPSLSLLLEFTQVRVVLEPQAAALAATSASESQIHDIEKALKRMADADEGLDDPLDADIAFHSAVLAASNNRFLQQLTEFISTALRVSIRYTNRIKGVPGADVQKHGDILRAIQARDPKQARHTVEILLEEAIQLIESKLE
jgi:DNA-binding FadR family transcriptional regulator